LQAAGFVAWDRRKYPIAMPNAPVPASPVGRRHYDAGCRQAFVGLDADWDEKVIVARRSVLASAVVAAQ
jgi:hypothetical protein